MRRSYWRGVHRRAVKETAALLHLDSREQLVIKALIVAAILAALGFWGSSDAASDEILARTVIAGIILLIFPFVYMWKLYGVPASMDDEKARRIAQLEQSHHNPLRIYYDHGTVSRDVVISESGPEKIVQRCCLSLANASHNVVLRDVSMRIIEINDIRTLHEFLPIELAVATGQARERIYVAPQEIVMFEVGRQSMTGGKAQDFTFISGLTINARPLWFSVAAVTAETAAFACFEVVSDEQGFAHLEERDKEWRQ